MNMPKRPSTASCVSRRKFICMVLVLLTCSIAGWWAFTVRKRDGMSIIIAVLRKRLGYLSLDDGGMKRFADDYERHADPSTKRRLGRLGLIAPAYKVLDLAKVAPGMRWVTAVEDKIVCQFLLSSDFFMHDANETRIVHYIGYYDSYVRLCGNTLARFH